MTDFQDHHLSDTNFTICSNYHYLYMIACDHRYAADIHQVINVFLYLNGDDYRAIQIIYHF